MNVFNCNIYIQISLEALDALSDNRLRTILSLLGVAIGIAAVIVISSVATSGRTVIFKELETFGLKSFWVYREYNPEKKLEKNKSYSGINEHDYKTILNAAPPSVESLSPIIDDDSYSLPVSKNGHSINIKLIGVNEHYADINGDKLVQGRFFSLKDIRDHAHVAVIGSEVLTRLFSSLDNVMGQKISIGKNWFIIVGVLEEKGRDLINSIGAGDQQTGSRILIPYSTRQKNLGKSGFVSYLQGQSTHLDTAEDALKEIITILEKQYHKDYDYKGESMSTYVETANRILSGVTLIGIISATVSLLVGGLAIMNIMTTSVIERTNEIGLRRAIGASASDIRFQFLMESVFISILGGLFGIILGISLVHLLAFFLGLNLFIATNGLVIAIISTFFIGVLSGYYPAIKASKLVPVEALRFG